MHRILFKGGGEGYKGIEYTRFFICTKVTPQERLHTQVPFSIFSIQKMPARGLIYTGELLIYRRTFKSFKNAFEK